MTGVIYFYNDPKGFGFIRMPDDSEIFFHITHVENKRAEIGMRVEFDIGPAMNKKSQAIHVRPVESPAGVAALSGGVV
jgi:cold shock CspA family protein